MTTYEELKARGLIAQVTDEEKSMELLNTTSLKAYEVGEKVGMPDAHYFGLAFKKYTGKTINEFRNLSRSQNHDI